MAEAEDILGYWDETPPGFLSLGRIEAMLAAWLGVKRTKGLPATPMDAMRELGQVPGISVGRDVHEGLGAVVLDFDELRKKNHGR